MTQEDVVYRFRLRTMALAEEIGNVRATCRIMVPSVSEEEGASEAIRDE